MIRPAIIVFLFGILVGVALALWLRPKTVKENFETKDTTVPLSASEKELFEDLKNDRLTEKQIDKLIKLGTITDSLMDKFMVKAMDDVKQKFTDLKTEDPLGKALTEVKKPEEEEVAKPKVTFKVPVKKSTEEDSEEESEESEKPKKPLAPKKERMTIEESPDSPSHIQVKPYRAKVEGFSGSRFEPPAYAKI
jgi:lipopolysaccharide export LptBFGC system permease protein LptF